MIEKTTLPVRPDTSCFVDGRAICDIFDLNGVKWIAKGQVVTKKQITIALKKGSTTKVDFKADNIVVQQRSLKSELKPTFEDIVQITNQIEITEENIKRDLKSSGTFTTTTIKELQKTTNSISDLIKSNQFSPYKLNGLTTYLYNDKNFISKRPLLKMLNNSGIQYMLFKDIIDDNIDDFVTANILNPFERIDENFEKTDEAEITISPEEFTKYAQQASKDLLSAIDSGKLQSSFLADLLKYFSPRLYFTSPELRLYQQINNYVNFAMPGKVQEKTPL